MRRINVLLIGKDPTIVAQALRGEGESLTRHVSYADCLRERNPGSEVKMIVHSQWEPTAMNLQFGTFSLIPSRSRFRATFLHDVYRAAQGLVRSGWIPDVISAQTPWEEALIAHYLANKFKARFLAQLHFDMTSEAWVTQGPLNRVRRFVALHVLRRADAIRVVSPGIRDGLVSIFGIPAERIFVAPVPVAFDGTPLNAGADECKAAFVPEWRNQPIVTYVGRLHREKYLTNWVRVAADVARRVPAARFLLVGDGPEAASLERLVHELGLEKCVRFCGGVRHEELAGFYRASDVLLLTSAYEGFGRVIVEAGMCGVPCVATNCAGPQAVIRSGETGYLCDFNRRSEYSDRVVELLGEPEKRRALGRAAQLYMTDLFSPQRLTRQVVETWEKTASLQ